MTGYSCFPEGEAGGVDEYAVEKTLVSSSNSVTVCWSLSEWMKLVKVAVWLEMMSTRTVTVR